VTGAVGATAGGSGASAGAAADSAAGGVVTADESERAAVLFAVESVGSVGAAGAIAAAATTGPGASASGDRPQAAPTNAAATTAATAIRKWRPIIGEDPHGIDVTLIGSRK
jgi:hypothetical protein